MDAVMGRLEQLFEGAEAHLNQLLAKKWRRRIASAVVVVTGVLSLVTSTWWLGLVAFSMTVALIVVALDDT
jgi:hypothetical protein